MPESFALDWYVFVALTNKKLWFPLQCRLNTNLSFDFVKLIGYLAYADNAVPSNPCVGPLPRIKISFPVLSACTDELISTPKIMAFSP